MGWTGILQVAKKISTLRLQHHGTAVEDELLMTVPR